MRNQRFITLTIWKSTEQVLDGFYYHDQSGHFEAGNPHIVQMKELTCLVPGNDGTKTETGFDGLYMVNNLGKAYCGASGQIYDRADGG